MSLAEILPRPGIKRRRQEPNSTEAGGAFASIIAEMHKKGRITVRQAAAAQMFLNDLAAYHGSTGVSGYAERVDSSTASHKLKGWTQAHINCQTILDRLWYHERCTLNYLILRREKARGSLADFGREAFGYKDQDMAVASATAKIASLLESLAEFYLGHEHAYC